MPADTKPPLLTVEQLDSMLRMAERINAEPEMRTALRMARALAVLQEMEGEASYRDDGARFEVSLWTGATFLLGDGPTLTEAVENAGRYPGPAESATLPEKPACPECEGSGEILLPIPDGPNAGEMFTRECPRGCVREKPATCGTCGGRREIAASAGLHSWDNGYKPCPDCAGART